MPCNKSNFWVARLRRILLCLMLSAVIHHKGAKIDFSTIAFWRKPAGHLDKKLLNIYNFPYKH